MGQGDPGGQHQAGVIADAFHKSANGRDGSLSPVPARYPRRLLFPSTADIAPTGRGRASWAKSRPNRLPALTSRFRLVGEKSYDARGARDRHASQPRT